MSAVTPAQLATAAGDIDALVPGAVLVRNRVGNLAIMRTGVCLGWLDLSTAEVHLDGERAGNVVRISYDPAMVGSTADDRAQPDASRQLPHHPTTEG